MLPTSSRPDRVPILALLALSLTLGATGPTAPGAEPAQYPYFGPYVKSSGPDSMLAIVEIRSTYAIERDLAATTRQRSEAQAREVTTRFLKTRAGLAIKIKDTEINALEAMMDQADSEDDEPRKELLETNRDIARVEKKLLKEREHLRNNDIDFAKAEVACRTAEMASYGQELDLARKRERRLSLEGEDLSRDGFEAAWKLDREIREAEGRTLEAQSEAARALKKLADEAVEIARSRRKVWEAQRVLINRTQP